MTRATATSRQRVAVVTGGASGLGAAIAERLAEEGAHVIIADVDADAAASVRARIEAAGRRATVVVADVTRSADVQRAMETAEEAGHLQALVLSAAIEIRRDLTATNDDEWQRVIDVDLKGPFLCMKYGIPSMVRGGGGSIVALGSTLGAIGQPGYAAYCAAKGALVNLCKQAAIEHAPDGIRVNVVSPSACDAGLFLRVAEHSGNAGAIKQQVIRNVPAGRLGHAADVTALVSFLVGDASTYISGTVVPLDGGLAARRQ
jgi:NAD(P)-dependent dehydrogenase (short-subunit alcohol dehydrogenase family)